MAPIVLVRKRATGGGPAPVAPTNTVAPVVTGTATVGELLSTTDGTWTGTPVIAFTYQWQRDGVDIGGATANTYTLVDADFSHAIRAVVTGTNGAGSSSANSNATAAVTRTYSQQVIADGAVGFWKLGEASDASPALDSAGNQNGVYTNTTGTTPGQVGIPGGGGATACAFIRANSGYVAIADAASQHVGNVFTIEVWVKLTNYFDTQTFFCSAGANGPFLRFSGSNFKIEGGKAGVSIDYTSSIVAPNDGAYHHYVWTKNGATGKLYIDGVDRTTGAASTIVNAAGYRIGADNTPAFYADSTIAMVSLYPTALGAGAVANHFTLGST